MNGSRYLLSWLPGEYHSVLIRMAIALPAPARAGLPRPPDQGVDQMNLPTKARTGLLLTCVVAAAIAGSAVAQEGPREPADEKAEEDPVDERRQALVSKIWWNQPQKVEELGLSDQQRSEMDAALQRYLAGRGGAKTQRREALEALGKALGEGDAKAARSVGDELAGLSSGPIRDQVGMMIEVVAVLTPQQRQKTGSLYPRLLSGLWIRSANPRGLLKGRRP